MLCPLTDALALTFQNSAERADNSWLSLQHLRPPSGANAVPTWTENKCKWNNKPQPQRENTRIPREVLKSFLLKAHCGESIQRAVTETEAQATTLPLRDMEPGVSRIGMQNQVSKSKAAITWISAEKWMSWWGAEVSFGQVSSTGDAKEHSCNSAGPLLLTWLFFFVSLHQVYCLHSLGTGRGCQYKGKEGLSW